LPRFSGPYFEDSARAASGEVVSVISGTDCAHSQIIAIGRRFQPRRAFIEPVNDKHAVARTNPVIPELRFCLMVWFPSRVSRQN